MKFFSFFFLCIPGANGQSKITNLPRRMCLGGTTCIDGGDFCVHTQPVEWRPDGLRGGVLMKMIVGKRRG